MIVYSGTKSQFRQDVMTNDIGGIIATTFKSVTGHRTKQSEINSWVNSLQYMDRVIADPEIPEDAGVAIEYHIPRSSKRIDFILTGADEHNTDTAILVELKQWQQAELSTKDGVVVTTFQGGPQETAHMWLRCLSPQRPSPSRWPWAAPPITQSFSRPSNAPPRRLTRLLPRRSPSPTAPA